MTEELNNPGYEIPAELQGQVAITTLDKIYNWGRRSSIWPMMFGLACCAIEMIVTATSRFDFARFGMEIMRPSPRQSDLMIVAGRVSRKMAPILRRLYDQMPDPKWVISMGDCASWVGSLTTTRSCRGWMKSYRLIFTLQAAHRDLKRSYTAYCPFMRR